MTGAHATWLCAVAVLCLGAACRPTPGQGGPTSPAAGERDPVDTACRWPAPPIVEHRDGAGILLRWQLPASDVLFQPVLPHHPAFLAYRATIRADGGALRRPIADEPVARTDQERAIWAKERANGELAHSGQVGRIAPIQCLDALLFAWQHQRYSQLDRPTEFIASVLRKSAGDTDQLLVVFGASDQMFPAKAFYGFDVVDRYRADGWQFWYVLHNHTVQKNGERWALGNPVLSSSDVQLMRNLAAGRGLQSARVTNGFYTYSAQAAEFSRLQGR